MTWKKFTEKVRRGGPKISIWKKNGAIGFNSVFVKKFDLVNYKFVILFSDQPNKRIGFQFSNNEEGAVAKIIKRRGGGFSMSATAFLNDCGISNDVTRSYPVHFDDKDQIYFVNLSEGRDKTRRKIKKRALA